MEQKVVQTFEVVCHSVRRACADLEAQHTQTLLSGLGQEDASTVVSTMGIFFLYLCDTRDLSDDSPGNRLITNFGTIHRWATIVAQRPIAELVLLLKGIDGQLMTGLPIHLSTDVDDMAILLFGRKLPTEEWKSEGPDQILNRRICHERCIFITRITLKSGRDDEADQIEAWCDHDSKLPSYEEMLERDASVLKVSRIFHYHLDGWDPNGHFRPKFGPGAVADCKGLAGRPGTKFLYYGPLTQSQDYACRHLGLVIPDTYACDRERMAARLFFVAKDAVKKRSICIEHATVSYIQQGLSRSLDTYLSRRGCWFRWSIDDQNNNRRMLSRPDCVTVDLSSASDSVSWDFVKHSSPTRALYAFNAARTQDVDTGRGTIHLRKFASMGSALCFPVETLLFNCIAWVSCIESGISSRGASHGISVFGDDIIVPEAAYDRLCQLLDCMGFKVNMSKTFNRDNPVRESCGWERWPYLGMSSPLRLSRKYSWEWHKHPRRFSSSIAQFANRAFERGMFLVRLLLCNLARHADCYFSDSWSDLDDSLLPWEEPSSWAVYSPDVSNSHLTVELSSKHRRSLKQSDYQRLEVRRYSLTSRYVAIDSIPRYQHVLLYPSRESDTSPPDTWDVIHPKQAKRTWQAFRS